MDRRLLYTSSDSSVSSHSSSSSLIPLAFVTVYGLSTAAVALSSAAILLCMAALLNSEVAIWERKVRIQKGLLEARSLLCDAELGAPGGGQIELSHLPPRNVAMDSVR